MSASHVKDVNTAEDGLPIRVRTTDAPAGDTLLDNTVRRLNERGLAFLIKAAQRSDCADRQRSWEGIFSSWAAASHCIVARAARCPMVLLDLNFQRVSWWYRVINTRPCEVPRNRLLSAFQTDEAIPLAHDLLLEVWSAARSTPHVSSLVFGVAPDVTALIARLSPRELDRVVVHEIECLGPRWANRPMFWRELFEAATQPDDQILANVHLHCLQLLGGELASARGTLQPSAGANEPAKETSVQES